MIFNFILTLFVTLTRYNYNSHLYFTDKSNKNEPTFNYHKTNLYVLIHNNIFF